MAADVGICASNKPGDFGFDQLVRMQPKAVLLMEANEGGIGALREAIPGVFLYARAEDAGRAWDPVDARYTPEGYAEDFAAFVEECKPDCGVPWNEANVEWKSVFPNPDNCTPDQYRFYCAWSAKFLRRYRQLSKIPIAFPAMSPGHRTDDYEQNSVQLAAQAAGWDEVHFHFYYPRFTEWEGQRWRRELPFYANVGRPLVVSETNRPFNRNDAADVAAMLTDTRRFCREAGRYFRRILYFIENSESFPELNARDTPVADLLAELARTPQGGDFMPLKPTSVTFNAIPDVHPSGMVHLTGEVSGLDGPQAAAQILVNYPPHDGDTNWGQGGKTVAAIVDGPFDYWVQLGPENYPVTAPLEGTVQMFTLELDPTGLASGQWGEDPEFTTAFTIIPGADVLPDPVEVPPAPAGAVVDLARTKVFFACGDGFNADGNPIWLQIQQAVQAMKEGRTDFFSRPR